MNAARHYLTRWAAWRGRSANRRIFASMLTVGSSSFVVLILAMTKQLVVARYFGTTDGLDAFLVAFALPTFAVGVLAGSLNAAFIPSFIHVRESRGVLAAQQLMANVLAGSLLLLAAVTVLFALGGGTLLHLMAPAFSAEKLALTLRIYWILLPLIVLGGASQIWAAVMNAGERFALAAVAPLGTSVVPIILLLVMGTRFGIYALAAGTTIGSIVEMTLLWFGLRAIGYSARPRLRGLDESTRETMRQYLPVLAGSILALASPVVDQSMASRLGAGSVAALGYGGKVVSAVLGVSATSLGVALLPHVSRMAAASDWAGVRHTLRTYTRLILAVALPVVVALVTLSRPIIRVLYERGAFSSADTLVVADVQACYLLQLPAYLVGILAVRILAAMKAVRVIVVISAVNLIVNIVGDWLLMRFMGVSGIALSTSLVYAGSTAMCLIAVRGELRKRTDALR
jgi:putative peptidoglycan lipid II flippase